MGGGENHDLPSPLLQDVPETGQGCLPQTSLRDSLFPGPTSFSVPSVLKSPLRVLRRLTKCRTLPLVSCSLPSIFISSLTEPPSAVCT